MVNKANGGKKTKQTNKKNSCFYVNVSFKAKLPWLSEILVRQHWNHSTCFQGNNVGVYGLRQTPFALCSFSCPVLVSSDKYKHSAVQFYIKSNRVFQPLNQTNSLLCFLMNRIFFLQIRHFQFITVQLKTF